MLRTGVLVAAGLVLLLGAAGWFRARLVVSPGATEVQPTSRIKVATTSDRQTHLDEPRVADARHQPWATAPAVAVAAKGYEETPAAKHLVTTLPPQPDRSDLSSPDGATRAASTPPAAPVDASGKLATATSGPATAAQTHVADATSADALSAELDRLIEEARRWDPSMNDQLAATVALARWKQTSRGGKADKDLLLAWRDRLIELGERADPNDPNGPDCFREAADICAMSGIEENDRAISLYQRCADHPACEPTNRIVALMSLGQMSTLAAGPRRNLYRAFDAWNQMGEAIDRLSEPLRSNWQRQRASIPMLKAQALMFGKPHDALALPPTDAGKSASDYVLEVLAADPEILNGSGYSRHELQRTLAHCYEKEGRIELAAEARWVLVEEAPDESAQTAALTAWAYTFDRNGGDKFADALRKGIERAQNTDPALQVQVLNGLVSGERFEHVLQLVSTTRFSADWLAAHPGEHAALLYAQLRAYVSERHFDQQKAKTLAEEFLAYFPNDPRAAQVEDILSSAER
jgi:tetratricopeptide (TPR) repeat protein